MVATTKEIERMRRLLAAGVSFERAYAEGRLK
jgi:hypothetical protein